MSDYWYGMLLGFGIFGFLIGFPFIYFYRQYKKEKFNAMVWKNQSLKMREESPKPIKYGIKKITVASNHTGITIEMVSENDFGLEWDVSDEGIWVKQKTDLYPYIKGFFTNHSIVYIERE